MQEIKIITFANNICEWLRAYKARTDDPLNCKQIYFLANLVQSVLLARCRNSTSFNELVKNCKTVPYDGYESIISVASLENDYVHMLKDHTSDKELLKRSMLDYCEDDWLYIIENNFNPLTYYIKKDRCYSYTDDVEYTIYDVVPRELFYPLDKQHFILSCYSLSTFTSLIFRSDLIQLIQKLKNDIGYCFDDPQELWELNYPTMLVSILNYIQDLAYKAFYNLYSLECIIELTKDFNKYLYTIHDLIWEDPYYDVGQSLLESEENY